VTIVALAYYVQESSSWPTSWRAQGISIEVIDPRTLVPMDVDTLRESVRGPADSSSWTRRRRPARRLEIAALIVEIATPSAR